MKNNSRKKDEIKGTLRFAQSSSQIKSDEIQIKSQILLLEGNIKTITRLLI